MSVRIQGWSVVMFFRFQNDHWKISYSSNNLLLMSNLLLTCSENNIYMQLLTKQYKNKCQIPSIVGAWR